MPNQYTGYPPLAERFWAKVDRNGPTPERHPEFGNCWLWTGGVTQGGYGCNGVKVDGVRTNFLTHRKSWELATGEPIPEGLRIAHTCDVRHCVRNDAEGVYAINGVLRPRHGHLWLATHTQNMHDAMAKGRSFNLGTWASEHADIVAENNRRRAREHPELIARGEAASQAKLTDAAVRDIRTGGEHWTALAERYHVSRATIYLVRQRKIWQHVT